LSENLKEVTIYSNFEYTI